MDVKLQINQDIAIEVIKNDKIYNIDRKESTLNLILIEILSTTLIFDHD